MKIIQQTSTFLQLSDRKLGYFFGFLFGSGLLMGIPIWRLGVSYGESQYIQLKCDNVSSNRPEPCILTNHQPFTVRLESEPLKSIRIDHEKDSESVIIRSKLVLLTEKGDCILPTSNDTDMSLYFQKIDNILKNGRDSGNQLEQLTIEKDLRISSFIWCAVWGLINLLFGASIIAVLLETPTSISWKFDKSKDSVTGEFYLFFRRIYHDEIPLSQIRELQWTSETKTSTDDDGKETKKVTFRIDLLLRSGEVVPLTSPMWSDYWKAENVETFALMISRFIDVEEPQLSEVSPAPSNVADVLKRAHLEQEQNQLKKQRSNRS
jgi:hypothetical protein